MFLGQGGSGVATAVMDGTAMGGNAEGGPGGHFCSGAGHTDSANQLSGCSQAGFKHVGALINRVGQGQAGEFDRELSEESGGHCRVCWGQLEQSRKEHVGQGFLNGLEDRGVAGGGALKVLPF